MRSCILEQKEGTEEKGTEKEDVLTEYLKVLLTRETITANKVVIPTIGYIRRNKCKC